MDEFGGCVRDVAALFVRRDSIYKSLPHVDAWDEDRDARKWPGGAPVVAHPPCKRWSILNNLVLVRYPDRAAEFAYGNDGGLFALALRQVRTWGGVLEHPAHSRAWRVFDLPQPGPNVWQRGICGGWCIQVDQAAFGHVARKLTWLYAFGMVPPLAPVAMGETSHRVRVYRKRNPDGSWSRIDNGRTSEVTHAAAEHTPAAFAAWLVDLARRAEIHCVADH